MMIVAFFGKEILICFVAWVENPSLEAAEFEFFDVISGLSGDLQSLIIYISIVSILTCPKSFEMI